MREYTPPIDVSKQTSKRVETENLAESGRPKLSIVINNGSFESEDPDNEASLSEFTGKRGVDLFASQGLRADSLLEVMNFRSPSHVMVIESGNCLRQAEFTGESSWNTWNGEIKEILVDSANSDSKVLFFDGESNGWFEVNGGTGEMQPVSDNEGMWAIFNERAVKH